MKATIRLNRKYKVRMVGSPSNRFAISSGRRQSTGSISERPKKQAKEKRNMQYFLQRTGLGHYIPVRQAISKFDSKDLTYIFQNYQYMRLQTTMLVRTFLV